jgi:hypothetical protein
MQQRSSFLELRKAVADDECTAEQLYNWWNRTVLQIASKFSDLKKSPSKAGMKTNKESVSVFVAVYQ